MPEKDDKIKWIKNGGGTHRMNTASGKSRIIKPGETFYARPSEIPESLRDVIVQIDPVATEPPLTTSTKFKVEERKADEAAPDTTADAKASTDAAAETAEAAASETADPGGAGVGDVTGDNDKPDGNGPAEGDAAHKLETRSPGWFDVVNVASGKAVNDQALRETDAKDLLKSLEG